MIKLLSIVLTPILALLAVSSSYFVSAVTSYSTSSEIRQSMVFSRDIGSFLRLFQRERDMSAFYASRIGSDTKDLLLNCYTETDEALKVCIFYSNLDILHYSFNMLFKNSHLYIYIVRLKK